MKLGGRDHKTLPHASVKMDAEHLHVATAVSSPLPTGKAGATIQIGLDTALVPHDDIRHTRTDRHNLDAEFVAQDPGIVEERLTTMEGMVISPAEADAMHTDQSLTYPWSVGFGHIVHCETSGFVKNNSVH
jgi:hypothetical protein